MCARERKREGERAMGVVNDVNALITPNYLFPLHVTGFVSYSERSQNILKMFSQPLLALSRTLKETSPLEHLPRFESVDPPDLGRGHRPQLSSSPSQSLAPQSLLICAC